MNNLTKRRINENGFTLIEVLIALLLSAIILAAMSSLFTTSGKVFQQTKDVSDVKELSKGGMAQLEWLFQRWGTSTPCYNEDTSQCTSALNCQVSAIYPYPPPSSICITIINDGNSNPCDEAHFYANLSGNGFVHIPEIADPTIMNIKSCRLSTASGQNCYHIKMGAKFITDKENPNAYKPLVFYLSNLSNNDLVCTDGTLTSNAVMSATATALNGSLKNDAGALITDYVFEGGEIILRVPHKIRLFCQNNPEDSNKRWLYLEATDMAPSCQADEPAQPLIPVNSFDIVTQEEGVVVTMQVRGPSGNIMNIKRTFAR